MAATSAIAVGLGFNETNATKTGFGYGNEIYLCSQIELQTKAVLTYQSGNAGVITGIAQKSGVTDFGFRYSKLANRMIQAAFPATEIAPMSIAGWTHEVKISVPNSSQSFGSDLYDLKNFVAGGLVAIVQITASNLGDYFVFGLDRGLEVSDAINGDRMELTLKTPKDMKEYRPYHIIAPTTGTAKTLLDGFKAT